jgi:hypothetical protein
MSVQDDGAIPVDVDGVSYEAIPVGVAHGGPIPFYRVQHRDPPHSLIGELNWHADIDAWVPAGIEPARETAILHAVIKKIRDRLGR